MLILLVTLVYSLAKFKTLYQYGDSLHLVTSEPLPMDHVFHASESMNKVSKGFNVAVVLYPRSNYYPLTEEEDPGA